MVRAVLPALIALLSLSACVRRFEEPRRDEPHAVVKVRIVHHAQPGPRLDEGVRWNEYEVAVPQPRGYVPTESLRVVRVRPEPSRWSFATTYFHTVTRTEYRTEYRTEQYACGTESSRTGSYTSTRTRYCSRQVPYQRLVTVTDRIVDGACRGAVLHQPIAGAMYVMQYDYFGDDRCSVQCLRQVGATDGTFRFVPCGAGEPPAGVTYPAGGEEALPPVATPPPSYR